MQKNRVIEKLRKNISWYVKNTGIELDNEEMSDNYDSNENEFKRIIAELKQKVNFLNDKKSYYKSKVSFFI